VLTTPRQVQEDLADLTARVSSCIDQHLETLGKLTGLPRMRLKNIELLVVDESERLSSTDAQALAAIARITHGNFRLVDRLFTQMERVMKISELHTITDDVVEAARSTLVIGI